MVGQGHHLGQGQPVTALSVQFVTKLLENYRKWLEKEPICSKASSIWSGHRPTVQRMYPPRSSVRGQMNKALRYKVYVAHAPTTRCTNERSTHVALKSRSWPIMALLLKCILRTEK